MKLILYLSVLAVGAAGKSLIINTPVRGAAECQPQLVTWSGGTPPYFVSVRTFPLSETPAVNFGQQATNQLTWMVKVPLGTSLIYVIKDSTGRIATSARFKVTTGSGNSCIGTGSTPGGSAGSDPTIGASTAVHQSTFPASKFVSPTSSASSVFSASPTNTMSRQSLTINTPVRGAAECQPMLVTWSGGTPPYFVTVQTYPLSETPVVNFGQQATNQITWMVKVPLGTSLIYMIKDSTGVPASSAPFKVTRGSGNSCIKTGSTPGGSAGSDPTIRVSTAVHQSTSPASKFVSPASSASSSASPTNTMSLPASPKKINLTWPIAGVVGGLLLVLAEVGFLYWRVRCRGQSSAGFVDGLDGVEKQPSVHRLPTALAAQDEWAPVQLYSAVPSGEIQLSLPNQAVPRGILVAEEKERYTAAQQMDEEILGLTERAEAQGLSESTPLSSTGQSDSTNAQLLDSEGAEGSSD